MHNTISSVYPVEHVYIGYTQQCVLTHCISIGCTVIHPNIVHTIILTYNIYRV